MKPDTIGVSSITVSELYYGVSKSSKPNENAIALEQFLLPLIVISFNKDDAIAYGNLREKLVRRTLWKRFGNIIGSMDMLIGAQALNRELILVTNNEKEFSRIEGLSIENWLLT